LLAGCSRAHRMEACGGAHDWAGCVGGRGHTVKAMAPPCVKPSLELNTREMADAVAMRKTITGPTMRVVPVKDLAPQDIQPLHRVGRAGTADGIYASRLPWCEP
jgi:transposase